MTTSSPISAASAWPFRAPCSSATSAAPYSPSKEIEQVWRDIYADPDANIELQQLGETLADIAEGFAHWKYRHLMATRRTFGARPAYFGTEGVAWLAAHDGRDSVPRTLVGPHLHRQSGVTFAAGGLSAHAQALTHRMVRDAQHGGAFHRATAAEGRNLRWIRYRDLRQRVPRPL